VTWHQPLVLASGSARRRELLEQVGIPLEVVPTNADESVGSEVPGEEAVALIAERKAAAVAAHMPGRAILAADTLVRVDGRLLGKPADIAAARTMLTSLAGRWHDVLTGVVLVDNGGEIGRRLSVTRVRLADLTDEEIERYVAGPEPYDKAGGYGIQATAGWFVAEIQGSYSNVMGLPLECVRELLLDAGLPLPNLRSG
jgi:septum formation protein